MAERAGVYKVLSSTRWYAALQGWIGRPDTDERIRAGYLPEITARGVRILDIGCGPGTFLSSHDSHVRGEYVGFDPNPDYIQSARNLFPNRQFHVGTTATVAHLIEGPFDLAIAFGVLHHVDDEEAVTIARFAHSRLRDGGRFVSIDPVLLPRQHPIARGLAALDRGKHVRTAAGYHQLVAAGFPSSSVDTHIQSDWLRVPYNHVVVTTTKTS